VTVARHLDIVGRDQLAVIDGFLGRELGITASRGVQAGLPAILRSRMAVPKRKTSRARRDKRRAQHGIRAPRLSVCPNCRQPKRSHEMCPNCKTYRGREVEPLRAPIP